MTSGGGCVPISVLVPSFNNEAYIEDCLRTISWADEIVVCDSFSTDSTVEIASRYATKVLRHEYITSARQKNWAIPQVANEWVLIVDTDERVAPDLRQEIEDAVSRDGFAGFKIPRANFVFGRWMRHGDQWPDHQIRLFKRDLGRYEDRQVHAHVILDGSCGTLDTPLIHYPHPSFKSLRKTLLSRYTSWEARQKQKQGIRFAWPQLVVRPAGAFASRYIRRRGYRDGWQGLLMSGIWAAYVFITYRKLHDLENGKAVTPADS